jgi:uncharacterized membrane protein
MMWIVAKPDSIARAIIVLAFVVLASRYEVSDLMQVQGNGNAVERTDWREVMQRSSLQPQDQNRIEASVIIHRPVEKVFGFYSDFRNLPSFLGDVMAVEQIDSTTSRWTIQGRLGIQTHWTTRVTEERPNELIRYETVTSSPLKTCWEIYFAGSAVDETEVHEVMKTPLGRIGRLALAAVGKFPSKEQSSNLHRLKQLMETGTVTDTSYSVPGKFAEHPNLRKLKK